MLPKLLISLTSIQRIEEEIQMKAHITEFLQKQVPEDCLGLST